MADDGPVERDPVSARPDRARDVVTERGPAPSDWKLALIRLIEALVWPAAFIAVALIFRVPLTALLAALAHKLGA